MCIYKTDGRSPVFFPPRGHYFRDAARRKFGRAVQTKILIKLKLMVVDVFKLLRSENIFETALERLRSIASNIRVSQILFTFQQLRCQDSILSDMCYQSDKGSSSMF